MRRLTILVVTLGLVVGIAAPASATHGEPVDGLWWAIDAVDGSLMIMRVTELGGGDSEFFAVVLTDFWATGACTPASVYRGRTTNAIYDDGSTGNPPRLLATFDHNWCLGRSTPVPSFDVQFDVVASDQTLSLADGTLFHHIRG